MYLWPFPFPSQAAGTRRPKARPSSPTMAACSPVMPCRSFCVVRPGITFRPTAGLHFAPPAVQKPKKVLPPPAVPVRATPCRASPHSASCPSTHVGRHTWAPVPSRPLIPSGRAFAGQQPINSEITSTEPFHPCLSPKWGILCSVAVMFLMRSVRPYLRPSEASPSIRHRPAIHHHGDHFSLYPE